MSEVQQSGTREKLHSPSLQLKDKDSEQLSAMLLSGAQEWDDEQQGQLEAALELGLKAHANDQHKDRPYSEHLLRVANRIRYYLHIDDPEVIVAAILHDCVEDHAIDVINDGLASVDNSLLPAGRAADQLSPDQQQHLALAYIEEQFSPRTAQVVAAVTNPPSGSKPSAYEDKLAAYAEKVSVAIELAEAWLVKFADWCDNGLGVIHDIEAQGDKHEHFKRKYGLVLPILEARFERDDIQALLSEEAKAYVRQQFALGRQRLTLA